MSAAEPGRTLAPAPTRPATLLGGRVRHEQPPAGHRTGLEPVLLAASIPARPGDRVLEAGCGSGAGLLCLAARVPGLAGLGIERNGDVAALARRNLAANALDRFAIHTGDLATWQPDGQYDHAFANPPWHAADGTPSPDAGRDSARRAQPGLFAAWTAALARALRPRGSLTLVLGTAHLPAGLAALADAGCGAPAVFPFWPRTGQPARLVLVRGTKAGRGAARLLAGMVLHEAGGGFTAAAEAVLRDGASIDLA